MRTQLLKTTHVVTRYGSRSFAVCGPAAWNSLPVAVRDLSSSSSYFYHKTELFSRAYGVIPSQHVRDSFAIRMGEHKLSYLLTYLLIYLHYT